jgi:predicted dehydrogenase
MHGHRLRAGERGCGEVLAAQGVANRRFLRGSGNSDRFEFNNSRGAWEIALQALEAGKSVYNEKPLAPRRKEARTMIGLAKERGLRIGCAPDTFLGGGLQTCRKLIDEGAIGVPVAATAFMLSRGVESWHPNPDFFYRKGAGPLFDMGPYYLSALTTLLGPVERVTASARISFPERTILHGERRGESINVSTPTHHSACLEFATGPIGTLVTSFDVHAHGHHPIEIYGSEGSIKVPDPNTFAGPVLLKKAGDADWQEVPISFGYTENSRGIGLADMARGMITGRDHRANERVAFHVLDVMHSIMDSAKTGRHQQVATTMSRPEPSPQVSLPVVWTSEPLPGHPQMRNGHPANKPKKGWTPPAGQRTNFA